MNEVYNTDCLEYMRTLPDKAFQLAIADPQAAAAASGEEDITDDDNTQTGGNQGGGTTGGELEG